MASISTIHAPESHTWFFQCPRIIASSTMSVSTLAMNCDFPPPMNNKNKKQVSLQLLSPLTRLVSSKVGTLRFCDQHFDHFEPSEQDLDPPNWFDFGDFVAREALLDEEYREAAWLRAQNKWKDPTYRRYGDDYKMKLAEQERKKQNNSALQNVVGTFDLNIRYSLLRETFPGDRHGAPSVCRINRASLSISRYGYIANFCVAKSVRREGVADCMLYFAVECAKPYGVKRVYANVDIKNRRVLMMYQNMGFEMVEKTNYLSVENEDFLFRLEM
ncbi:hypothetical protein RJT34_33058 [Clitoria ternatea]|uniref:N-acetyltransferase domain-containing protein n=1 Tax=Clitoria ternatea TaxID=43366 RepID=A0AAN9EZN0_CLITE